MTKLFKVKNHQGLDFIITATTKEEVVRAINRLRDSTKVTISDVKEIQYQM